MSNRQTIVLMAFGFIPVTWLALLLAPSFEGGLMKVLEDFPQTLSSPLGITLCDSSLKSICFFALAYITGIGIYFGTKRNYRRGEEMGSAKWGDEIKLCKKYASKNHEDNKILTQNVRIGFDSRAHRRNLNVLVCGGSGSGKTRFYCKPNIIQANSSMVILDPNR